MKLTVQVKLLPSSAQSLVLRETLETANRAADKVSEMAWDGKQFNRFGLQKLHYKSIRSEFAVSAQVAVRLFAKVADAYKRDRKVQRVFRKHGSISYDKRILSFKLAASTVSLWAVGGRLTVPFVCGDAQRKLLELPKGESDLILRNGKWFLNVTVEVPEESESAVVDVLGVDMGIVQIAFDSDGTNYSGSALNKVRSRNLSLRKKLQRKGTKSAKRLLRKRAKWEANFSRNINHIISKRIVQTAQRTKRAVAIEDIGGIRSRVRAKKRERTRLHSWAFAKLRGFIAYKAQRSGVKLITVDPAYTSQKCSKCGHTEKANRKSQSEFVCKVCGHTSHADENGALNIRDNGLEILRAGVVKSPNVAAISYGKIHSFTQLQAASL